MAIAASSVLPENSLEDFRIEFNNLVSDVTGITATNKFDENIIFEGATEDAHETTLTVVDPTADRTVTLPNITGTVLVGTQANPDSADGAALGSASAEWSDLYLADSGNIYFGNDQEIVLGHNPDVGLLLKNANAADDKPIVLNLQTGEQDIQASDVLGSIRFNAPDEGTGTDALLVSAAIDAVSEGDFSSSSNATKLSFRTGASETATEKMVITSGGNLALPTDGAVLNFGADSEITLTHVHDQGLRMEDSDKLTFGAGDDLQIYHDGSNSYVVYAGRGKLHLGGDAGVNITNAAVNEDFITCITDGAVTLYHDNSAKLTTTSAGVTITGTLTATTSIIPDAPDGAYLGDTSNGWSDFYLTDGAVIYFGDDQDVQLEHVADTGLRFPDGDKLIFGAGNDLTITHDGSNSIINDAGTGALQINASQVNINGGTDGAEAMASFADDGAVTLYYDNSVKLATSSTGISVTGAGTFSTGAAVKNGSTSAGFVEFYEDSDNGSNKATLIGPSSTADVTLTLPAVTDTVAVQGDVTALAIALG